MKTSHPDVCASFSVAVLGGSEGAYLMSLSYGVTGDGFVIITK